MKQTKRIMAFLMALLLTVTMLPVSVFAAENPTFTVSSASGKAGDEVTLSVDISNNPGFFAAQWTVSYDETRLEKVEYVMEEIDGVMLSNKNNNFLWENTAFEDIQYNGKVLDLKFKVKEDAPAGDAEVTITNLFAGKSNSAEVKFDVVAGKVTVAEKLETLIPFTKANHTDSGAPIHDKYSGIVGLKVEGIKVADWTEWQQGFNYQNQGITIFVDAASKDDTATLSLILKEGQAGSGSIIDAPATVKLNNGAGSFTASYMKIGTGGLAPMLHIPITFKLACTEHDWADATCSAPKTCTICGATEGEPDPEAHNYVDGVCEYCGDVKEPETYEVKVFGSVNDWFFVSEGKSESGNEIIGEKLEAVPVEENGDYGFVVTVPNDVTRLCYFEGSLAQGFNVSPENNVVKIDYVELTVKTPDGKGCENAEVSIVDEEGYNVLAYDYEWNGMYSIYGVEGVKYIITVTAPGYKTAVVEKVFEYKNGYQTFDIVLECNHNWVDATCEAPKTCTICGATEGEALGHNWGAVSYKWEEENGALSCTATRVCQNDAAHTESAEATVTSEVEKEPTCTESGITKYTATFDVDWAETQTNSKADTEALGHDYEAVVTELTCTEGGYTTYTCSACGDSYVADEVPALGHDWEVSYEWAEDGSACTATRTCKNDQNHTETATATEIKSEVAKPATCSAMGDTRYEAIFAEDWAHDYKAITDIPVDEDAHEWGEWVTTKEPTYSETGLKERECELCDEKEEQVIPKKNRPSSGNGSSNKPNPGVTEIVPGKGEEKNPNTGAPVFDLTAAGIVVLMATAAVLEIKRRK
ncbi:MAG: hypothetical protein IJ306_01860 [Oscillospiraceae bacterium]|nr:hypothetical protein [Oscillospiraceae bacterium]